LLGLQKYYRNKNDACPPLSYPFLSFCPVSFSSLLLLHRIHTSFGPQKKHGEEHNPQPQSSRSPGIVTADNLTSAEAKCGFALLYLRPPIHSVRIVARFLLLRGAILGCVYASPKQQHKNNNHCQHSPILLTPPPSSFHLHLPLPICTLLLVYSIPLQFLYYSISNIDAVPTLPPTRH
jgi:hypothetical protein